MPSPIETFEEFWPSYLGRHRRPANRVLRYVGTAAGLATFATAVALAVSVAPAFPWLAPAAPFVGSGPPWVGHFAIERNRPATLRHPVWSARAEFRMLGLFLSGRLGPHLAHVGRRVGAGVPPTRRPASGRRPRADGIARR